MDLGYRVYIVADAVTSVKVQDRIVGLNRAQSEGVKFVTSESVIFELMKTAKYEHFKKILPIVKDVAKNLMAHL
jgi:hypothetical protein